MNRVLSQTFSNFNTSYVVIKPMEKCSTGLPKTNFNTSYVVIKPNIAANASMRNAFQYILCCY